MLDNYLQQTTSADDIFRCIFFLGTLRVKIHAPIEVQEQDYSLQKLLLPSADISNGLDPDQDQSSVRLFANDNKKSPLARKE